jgi:hypothetical protein
VQLAAAYRHSAKIGPVARELQHHAVGLTWYETGGMRRAAHALRDGDRVWLIDPFEDQDALEAAAGLGTPAGVIQLLDRHARDCEAIATRLAVPHLRVPEALGDAPFEVISVADRPWWHEVALWWEAERALVVAEALGTAPAFALGRALGVHPLLRMVPPRAALGGRRPQLLLVGHGPALETQASEALERALACSRGDIPKLALSLPSLIRDR